jgi:hypothetical protein
MTTKSAHIIPSEAGWVVKKERDRARGGAVYATQKQAIDAAQRIVDKSRSGQIVVHSRNGSIRFRGIHGLPQVQTPPQKSSLGTKTIERAVSTVLRERL